MEDNFMNYRDIRIFQIIEKDCLKNRIIWIKDEITPETEFLFEKMINKIVELDKENGINPKDTEPIQIHISSYGGCVHSTLSICDTIERLKSMKYKVYGYAHAKAMSGAFKILISCTKRFAKPSSDLMCHMPNGFEYGYKTMEDKRREYEAIKRLWERCKNIILKNTNISEDLLNEYIGRNEDLYFWADESIINNMGIIDELF